MHLHMKPVVDIIVLPTRGLLSPWQQEHSQIEAGRQIPCGPLAHSVNSGLGFVHLGSKILLAESATNVPGLLELASS